MDYEAIEGYNHDNDYSDEVVFKVDVKSKTITPVKDQTLIAGECNSQYIAFEIPRYYDGIDLSEKKIQVLYISPDGHTDINKVINAQRSEDTLQFGWVVPGEALTSAGILAFSIEFAGDKYALKTRTIEKEIFDGMTGSDVVPEPLEQEWYIQIQSRCEDLLNEVDTLKESVQVSITKLEKELEDTKKYVGDKKEKLAAIVTEKGVETASTDSFDVIINNAKEIQTGISLTHVIGTTTTTSNCASIKTIAAHAPYVE